MNNQERKETAKRYYTAISNNSVLSCRMSPVCKGDVVLKVFNPTFKSTGNVTIGVRPQFNEIFLACEVGVYHSTELSKYRES